MVIVMPLIWIIVIAVRLLVLLVQALIYLVTLIWFLLFYPWIRVRIPRTVWAGPPKPGMRETWASFHHTEDDR